MPRYGVRAVNDPSATNVAQAVIFGVNRKTAEGQIFMPAFGEVFRRRHRVRGQLPRRPFRRQRRKLDTQGRRRSAQAGQPTIQFCGGTQ